jgi:hypothetical protein
MKLEHEHQDTYDKMFIYTIYRVSFSHKYCIEKSAVQGCISPFLYITVRTNHEELKQMTQACEQTEVRNEKLKLSVWHAV